MGGGRSRRNAFLFKFELNNTSRGRHCPIDHYCQLTIMLETPTLLIDGKKTAGDTNDPNYTQRRKSSFPIIRANRFLPEQLVLRRPHDHTGLRHVIEERFPRHLESRHARCAIREYRDPIRLVWGPVVQYVAHGVIDAMAQCLTAHEQPLRARFELHNRGVCPSSQ